MQRLELVALLEDSKKIIDFLQRKGLVEVTSHELPENMFSFDTSYNVSQFEKFTQTATQAKEILNSYAPKKASLVDSFRPPREIALSQFLDMADDADITMSKCYDIIEASKEIQQAKNDIIRLETANSSLSIWEGLDIPLRSAPTKFTQVLIGTFPDLQTEQSINERLAQLVPEIDAFEVESVYSSEMQSCAAVLCLQKDADRLLEALRSFGFVKPNDLPDRPVSEVINENRAKIAALESEIEKQQDVIRGFEAEHDRIDFLIDYYRLRADKYEALQKLSVTNSVFYLSGYVPEKYAKDVVSALEEKYSAAVTLSEPGEDEEVPVLVENNAFGAAVEGITDMYSPPGKNDIDPNNIMAFFYYVFFGMMFSDAGYGLLMVIATLFILLKSKPEGEKRKTVMMYLYCGISTVFWGIMFGSFFGDVINTVRTNFLHLPEMRLYVWLNPQGDDLMLTMLWCFLFGIVHLFVGAGIKGYMQWRQGDKFGAIVDPLSVYLAVGGAAPICAGMIISVPEAVTTIGKYCALAGVILIVLTAGRSSKGIVGKLGGGLYALYNTVSGYLSDVLSYSRLLALGLVTGIIGSVVNLMGTLPQNMFIKAILFIVVFIFGHAVNFGINVIGAYVHTNRLQYVEFFSRFYEGGGVAFNPLKVNSKTFKIKEETNNG